MKNYLEINEKIRSRKVCTSFEDNTYYNMKLFEHFCQHRDLKYVAIFGYYKIKYGWSNEEAQQMYDKAPDGWTDGVGVYRLYDWGRGENKINKGDDWDWHDPQLDHIIPRSRGGSDHPSNFQVLPTNINRILSDITDEQAPALIPIILEQFGFNK